MKYWLASLTPEQMVNWQPLKWLQLVIKDNTTMEETNLSTSFHLS